MKKTHADKTLHLTSAGRRGASGLCLHSLMKHALLYLAVVLAGCAAKPEAKPWNEPAAWTPGTKESITVSSYPEDAENSLTETQKTALARLRAVSHPVSSRSSFQSDPALRAVYLDWYAKGYTFTEATGLETIRPQAWAVDSPEYRAKVAGWQDGQFDARMKRIEGIFKELIERQNAATNAPAQHR